MFPLFNDVAFIHDEDDIGIFDGGKPVGDDKAGSPLHHLLKSLLNVKFSTSVDVASRLVENEHRRVY